MIRWLASAVSEIGWWEVLAGAALFASTFALSLLFVAVLLVYIPADFFVARHGKRPATMAGWIRRITKNLLGAVLVLLGFMLSVPGIPGQGLLTILIGVMLLDFPGKRRLVQKWIAGPRVLRTVNRLRVRYGRAPLLLKSPSARRGKETPSHEGASPDA